MLRIRAEIVSRDTLGKRCRKSWFGLVLASLGVIFTDGWPAHLVALCLLFSGLALFVRGWWPKIFLHIEPERIIEGIPEKREEIRRAWIYAGIIVLILASCSTWLYQKFGPSNPLREIVAILRNVDSKVNQILENLRKPTTTESVPNRSDISKDKVHRKRHEQPALPPQIEAPSSYGNLSGRVNDLADQIDDFPYLYGFLPSPRKDQFGNSLTPILGQHVMKGPSPQDIDQFKGWELSRESLFCFKYKKPMHDLVGELAEIHSKDDRVNEFLSEMDHERAYPGYMHEIATRLRGLVAQKQSVSK